MNHRHLICIVAWLLAVGMSVATTLPLQAQTPPPTLAPEQSCPLEAEWLQHIVRPGDRWATIAAEYSVNEADLRAANPTPLGLLRIGLPVRIPCVPGPVAPPYPTPRAASTVTASSGGASGSNVCTPPPGWGVRYTVQRGDTLSRLAAACRTTTAAIQQANGCRSGNVIYAGETLLLPCRPASLATATPTGSQPSASPGAITVPSIPPQPGSLRVALNPANAAVGATIGVTIQDARAHEPLVVTVKCGSQTMTTLGVMASSNGAATAAFSTAGFPAGRCRVDVARAGVGGSVLLTLTSASAPSVQTPSPSLATDATSAGTPTASLHDTPTHTMDTSPVTTSAPGLDIETHTPDAAPPATEDLEATPGVQKAPATPAPPTDAPPPTASSDAAPPAEAPPTSTPPPPTAPAPPTSPPTEPVTISAPAPTPTAPAPTPGDGEVGEPTATQPVAPP